LTFLDTKAPLLLLYREIEELPDLPRYDLVLSPQFYVMKHEDLPVKYPFQAKKLAPSVLEDLTGEGALTYEVLPENNGWTFFAYDREALSNFLYIKGGSIDRVGHIYFAEQLRDQLEPPIALNENKVLARVNDTATVVPSRLLAGSESFQTFDETMRPEKAFPLKHNHNSVLNTRQTLLLAGALSLLGLGYAAEGYRYGRNIKIQEQHLEKQLDAHPALRSSYAREATYKKYTALNTQQRRIRDRIKAISRLTGKETKLNSLNIDTKGYQATLNVPDKAKTRHAVKTILQSAGIKNAKYTGGKLEISEVFQ